MTTAPFVAQATRSPRQAQLHRFLRGCEVIAFETDHALPVGELLAATSTSDVVDAHVIVVAGERSAPTAISSDHVDMPKLADSVANPITIRPI